jgi:hypothetical protein
MNYKGLRDNGVSRTPRAYNYSSTSTAEISTDRKRSAGYLSLYIIDSE